MNPIIETIQKRLEKSRHREWLWFAILWCTGLASVLLIAIPVKILVIALK